MLTQKVFQVVSVHLKQAFFFSVWYMLEVEMSTISQPNSPEIVWSGCVKVATE